MSEATINKTRKFEHLFVYVVNALIFILYQNKTLKIGSDETEIRFGHKIVAGLKRNLMLLVVVVVVYDLLLLVRRAGHKHTGVGAPAPHFVKVACYTHP